MNGYALAREEALAMGAHWPLDWPGGDGVRTPERLGLANRPKRVGPIGGVQSWNLLTQHQEHLDFWRAFRLDQAQSAFAVEGAREAVRAMEARGWSVMALAITNGLQQCVEALWTPESARTLHDGLSVWHLALSHGSIETIRWMRTRLQEEGLLTSVAVPSAQGLTPLMCVATREPEVLRAALPWISPQDFWKLDAQGACALDFALTQMPTPRESLESSICLLLNSANALPKEDRKAKKSWIHWLRFALGVQCRLELNLEEFWQIKRAQKEHRILVQELSALGQSTGSETRSESRIVNAGPDETLHRLALRTETSLGASGGVEETTPLDTDTVAAASWSDRASKPEEPMTPKRRHASRI